MFDVDDDHRFLYALTIGIAVSGLLFWLTFWHGRVLLGAVWGLSACGWLFLRYRGLTEWNRLKTHGAPSQIREFRATMLILALIIVTVCIVMAVEGMLK